MTDLNEQLVKMLMESYDKGVADAKAAALEAFEKGIAAAVKAEREACAKVCDELEYYEDDGSILSGEYWAKSIRARGKE